MKQKVPSLKVVPDNIDTIDVTNHHIKIYCNDSIKEYRITIDELYQYFADRIKEESINRLKHRERSLK